MLFNTFNVVKRTNLSFPKGFVESLSCGLFRCPLPLAIHEMPELSALYESAPVHTPEDWELDIKVHMLMKNQYPCIPNWHCDNVPRDEEGKVRYDLIKKQTPPMLLWISDGPETEFLKHPLRALGVPKSHGDLAEHIRQSQLETVKLPPQCWVSMDQATPHRGTIATKHGWRIFARLTHKSIAPVRPVLSYQRRHSQVYLDASKFEW